MLSDNLNAQSLINFSYTKQGKVQCDTGSEFSVAAVLVLINADTIKDMKFLACCHYQLGRHYYNDDDNYIRAIYHYKKAINIREQYSDGLLGKSYRNLGYAHIYAGYYEQAIESILKACEHDESLKTQSSIYDYLSRAYCELGEYEKAITAAEKAIVAATSKGKGNAHNALSLVLIETRDSLNLIRAIEEADKAISSYKVREDMAITYNNKGNAFRWLGLYDEAIIAYKQALKDYSKQNVIDYANTLNNIATVLYAKKEYSEAIKMLNRSLKLKKNIHENTDFHKDFAVNYENLAENYEALKKHEKAIGYYNKSIDNLKNDPTSETPYIYNKPHLIRVLAIKAQAYKKMGKIAEAHHTYADLDNWINEFYKDLSTNASKLLWIDRIHTIYGNAIEVALMYNKPQKAFQYAEKAHAVLLWQSLSQQAARSLLSEDDKEKMDDLTAEIRQAEQRYRNGEIGIDALRTLERKREALEKTFENYKAYRDRKYQPEATTVSDIQSKIIDDHTAFIEYYRTDEVLYIFFITKNGLEIIPQNADGLADDISKFVKNISHKKLDVKNYHALAHKLYTQLIPSAIRSNDDIKHLVIVPDREIGTLPFAALATQTTSGILNQDTPFLVQKYSINYLYSAGSYLQLQQKTANQKYCFAGIAPVEYQMEKWNKKPLPFSEQELDGIKPLHWQWNREILMREQATKAEFERIIREGYHTIQVSTHAIFDENKGHIIFHDGALTQDEIDQLEINTHRLILSACETGVGTQNQGEGILSLGWNFAYKGVPSITMTHWSIIDVATKEIMVQYHENLNDGIHADQALQNAQQNYLKNITLNRQVHPYYWAAFFHTGNVK